LFQDQPAAREELEHLQALANHNIEIYRLRGEGSDPRDSEGADTVRRGGMRWG
jgi:pyruvate ferredoxin oxidoreductase beta subunit